MFQVLKVFLNLIILAWTVLKFGRFSSLGVLRRGVLRRPILLYYVKTIRVPPEHYGCHAEYHCLLVYSRQALACMGHGARAPPPKKKVRPKFSMHIMTCTSHPTHTLYAPPPPPGPRTKLPPLPPPPPSPPLTTLKGGPATCTIKGEVKAKIKISPVVVFGVLSRMIVVRGS